MLGPAAVLAYLLCAVLVSLVGLCLAEAGSRVSHPGGLYAYATAAFGPVVGGIAGTLLWFANSVVTSAAVANLLVDTLAMGVPAFGVGVWRFVVLVMLYAVLAAVNIRGARGGARLSMILAVVKIAPLVLLVIVGAFTVRMSNLEWVAVPAASQVGQTAVLLFFAFIGVEGGLNASGEVANPARTVPRAIFLALTLVAALYIGLQVVAQGVLGAGLAGAPAPLVAAATAVFGPWGARLFWVTTVLSVDRVPVRRRAVLSSKPGRAGGAPSAPARPRGRASALQDTGDRGRHVCAHVCDGRGVWIVPVPGHSGHVRDAGAVSDLLSRAASASRPWCRDIRSAVSRTWRIVCSARRFRDHPLAAVDTRVGGTGGGAVPRGRIGWRLCAAGALAKESESDRSSSGLRQRFGAWSSSRNG